MEINDERIKISHEEGKIVFRVDPSVPMGADHGEGIIYIETEDPMGALMDIGASLRQSGTSRRHRRSCT